jgi:hypothetical protein
MIARKEEPDSALFRHWYEFIIENSLDPAISKPVFVKVTEYQYAKRPRTGQTKRVDYIINFTWMKNGVSRHSVKTLDDVVSHMTTLFGNKVYQQVATALRLIKK